jgi:hypothetical protein
MKTETVVDPDELDELETGAAGATGATGSGEGDGKETPEKESTALEKAVQELATTQKTILEKVEKPKEEKQVELTPEQKAEFWGIYDPEKSDKEFFKKWFRLNPDATAEEIQATKELFAGVQKGIVSQSMKGSKNYVDHELEKLREELTPIREYVSKAEQKATRDEFFALYPALKEKKFEKILSIVATDLGKKNYTDRDQYFKELAEGSAAVIKGVDANFDLGKTTTPTSKSPKLPRTSAGGGGGAGKGASEGPMHLEDKSAEVLDD